jgi:flagellar protein FliO/FliZ
VNISIGMTPGGLRGRLNFFAASLTGLALSAAARAADHPFAAPTPAAMPASPAGLLRVVLGLALVLALVFAAAWLMRRLRAIQGAGTDGITVLAQTSLGARERVILVQVGGQKLLLGAGPGNVRTLLVLAADAPATSAATPLAERATAAALSTTAPARPTFTELLKRSLGK